jgi:hypothetical protein
MASVNSLTHPVASVIVCATFLVIALWHLYMAWSPAKGANGSVPSLDGKPLFVPSTRATILVAVMLVLFAGLVAATAGLLQLAVPRATLRWLSYVLAAGLFARAVGDFRFVGFFKRVRGTPFATLDYFLYSPICLLLAAGVSWIAYDATP